MLAKICWLATANRPAYEPASDPPPRKQPPVNPEDEAEAEPASDWEEEDAISISLNDEEERLNLVSPPLTSKVTVSVLNIDFLTKSLLCYENHSQYLLSMS